MFTMFAGGLGNHLFVGTKSSPSPFFALDAATGKPRVASPFTGGGFPIGEIDAIGSVDYTAGRVYFASLEFTPGARSLWCVTLTATGFGGAPCWTAPQTTFPDGIRGGPIQRANRVYVGDESGQVWAFDAANGTVVWQDATCGGGAPIKSFVLADRQGTAQDLYYATATTIPAESALCALRDTGGPAAAPKWGIPYSVINRPSQPLLARIGSPATAYIYVGSSDGFLYQIEADNPAAIKRVLIRPSAVIGAPSFDVTDNMIYVGTDAGAIYAVQAPLP
jgi:outer membrane protein assembly factor BamB